ncbi:MULTISPECIES: FAD-dependent oxidoreductase [Methylobacterium]|uniref:FAD-dependent oxidoreductase n=1 Tax=Methylobacterium TaxID=407 RepID=UPI0013EE06E8|nr:FAD-dependent oxidoreductase [Methylobacterium sp. DB0501]NGM34501.1 NAD(P)/FAD-dependent oxidoreductase [Methylobacterium sp. DB0501]
MTASHKIPDSSEDVIVSSQIPGKNLYILGMFDNGVTVLSQQTRALNLVWSLIENSRVPCVRPGELPQDRPERSIAIVGAGFAGLTTAAAFIKKGTNSRITLFEQRDTLLPLQHGSDTRWLHPHIYNWPANGSEANSAMLPVLNWTAARASDVVVQVLAEWSNIAEPYSKQIEIFCNTRYIQIYDYTSSNSNLKIEWIGEQRSIDGSSGIRDANLPAVGRTEIFDIVIIATGFGLEKDNTLSYWRNDIVGQPNLEQSRRMYLVSGQGDGAMIDLLRVRVSHYRQDRILYEIFSKSVELKREMKKLYEKTIKESSADLFANLENLSNIHKDEFDVVLKILSNRLRRDTDAILHMKIKKISELFNTDSIRISFQNKLLVYLLYKCGGFIPSTADEGKIRSEHAIPDDRILRRHGTDRLGQLQNLLSSELSSIIKNYRESSFSYSFRQTDKALWPGGYFGFFSSSEDIKKINVDNHITMQWRKEYLPGPTELVAASFCSTLAGVLQNIHPHDKRLRITLHRAINFGIEEVLQQCCEYFGIGLSHGKFTSAGRAFPADNATIGLAYKTRRIVRSVKGVSPNALEEVMQKLRLTTASGKMVADIHYIIAIPILEPETRGNFIGPNPVAGVIYIDSTAADFDIEDDDLMQIVQITNSFIAALEKSSSTTMNRIRNVPVGTSDCEPPNPQVLLPEFSSALEIVEGISPPVSASKFHFNFDYSDFIPVGESDM